MSTKKSAQDLLAQMAQVEQMERGKLSVMRETTRGPAYKLQAWENGQNRSRYVPPEQAEAVQAALAGYERYQALSEQYTELKIQETRAAIEAGSKKDPAPAVLLAQDQEIQRLIARFQSGATRGLAVQEFETLLRAAVFKSTSALVAFLLQQAADRVDASYQPKPKE